MKKNMGAADRIFRIITAAMLGFLYYNKNLTGTAGVVALILTGIFLLTSLAGSCPLYSLLGISSCRINKDHKHI